MKAQLHDVEQAVKWQQVCVLWQEKIQLITNEQTF